jgi:MoaA/NifB/PqqE/SkfB family radical SAM enzyme
MNASPSPSLLKTIWSGYASVCKRSLALLSRGHKLQYLIFYVTSRCHSKCPFCFNWQEQEKAQKKDELSLTETQKISSNIGNFEYLCLTGGEPFLREDLTNLCRVFIRKNSVRFVSIPTSALLPAKLERDLTYLLREFSQVGFRLTISMNGITDDFDRIHGIPGAFAKFLESLERLKKLNAKYSNIDIQINTVYSSYTEGKIDSIYRYAKEKIKPDNYAVTLLRGSPRFSNSKWKSLSTYKRMTHQIEKDAAIANFNNSNIYQKIFRALHIRSREIVLRCLEDKQMPINCTAGKKLIVIGETGKVFACEMLGREMGDLRRSGYNLNTILHSPTADKLRTFIRNKGCYCTWECAILNSLVFEPSTYLRTIQRMIQLERQ